MLSLSLRKDCFQYLMVRKEVKSSRASINVHTDADHAWVFPFLENKTELARVGKGSCFGELALLRREKRAANVSAMTDAKVGPI